MSTFTVTRVIKHHDAGHVATVSLAFGGAQLDYKVLCSKDGQPWVRGLRFGEPLRSQMRRAILAAAGYANGGQR